MHIVHALELLGVSLVLAFAFCVFCGLLCRAFGEMYVIIFIFLILAFSICYRVT